MLRHLLLLPLAAFAAEPAAPFRAPKAADVYAPSGAIRFSDDFSSGVFSPKWRFSENANYEVRAPDPERIRIVDAPGLPGRKAVRLAVARAPDVFRSEISLPHEKGWNERWYAQRLLIPSDWVRDPARAVDIVMQWHAIPGDFRSTFPNLEISVRDDRWIIRQSFGDPKTKPTRRETVLEDRLAPGVWTAWVVHVKWSPGPEGLLRIWKDGKLVADFAGPNTYGTIGLEYTPYLKTGLYRPEWHVSARPGGRERFDAEKPAVPRKLVYVTDVRVGDATASRELMEPR
ncbi:MAG: polysaccharide lyase [Opitutia bacterium]